MDSPNIHARTLQATWFAKAPSLPLAAPKLIATRGTLFQHLHSCRIQLGTASTLGMMAD